MFAGWYKDKDCTIPFNFEDSINADITLYAKWEDEGDDIPVGLTHHEAIARLTTYVTQVTKDATDAVTLYVQTNTFFDFEFSAISLGLTFEMTNVALTASFGMPYVTNETIISMFELFQYKNVEYKIENGKHVVKYISNEDGTSIPYGLTVEYDANTDSGRIIIYKNYGTSNQELDFVFEYVKTAKGYAIQTLLGQYIFEVNNNKVTKYKIAYYIEDGQRPTIYKNPSMINNDFASKDINNYLEYNGEKYIYYGNEYSYYPIEKYRNFTLEFTANGTKLNEDFGDWVIVDENE